LRRDGRRYPKMHEKLEQRIQEIFKEFLNKNNNGGLIELWKSDFDLQARVETAISYHFKELKDSFPLSAPYKRNPVDFCKSYINEMRKWATENLGVEEFKEE
jgi:hypothetical protein